MVYNYDGNLYASDEARMLAEMKDFTFRVGNIHEHSFEDVLRGEEFQRLLGATCNESLAGCAECAFQTYCGSDPVYHHATQGDMFGHRPTSGFCQKNMNIMKYLFTLLARDDRQLMRIFFTWIHDRGLVDTDREAPGCD